MGKIPELKLKGTPNKSGRHSVIIYYRCTDRQSRKATGVEVAKENWDPVTQKILGGERGSSIKNDIIYSKLTHARAIVFDYTALKRPLTKARFEAEMEQPLLRKDFLMFYRQSSLRNYERRVISKGTYEIETRTVKKLVKCFGESIMFSEISREWLETFDAWHTKYLQQKGHKGDGERLKALKKIQKYLRAAWDESPDAKPFNWPFHNFKWPNWSSKPTYLTQDELKELEKLYRNPKRIERVMGDRAKRLDMNPWNIPQYANPSGANRIRKVMCRFLFQCTTGIRLSDLLQLGWNHIENGRLIFTPQKTRDTSGKVVRMKVTQRIKQYIWNKRGMFHDRISDQKYNAYLKEVADLLGWEKHITSHVGRHTFATDCVHKGMPDSILAKLMGVKVETVQVYIHINDEMLDEWMEKL